MPSAAGRRDDLTILNGRRVRFGHIQRKNILNFAFVAACGPLQTHFHGRGRNGKRQLLRRFLRKRGAAVSVLALSVTYGDSSPKGRALGSPRKLHLFAKTSPFGRGGTA